VRLPIDRLEILGEPHRVRWSALDGSEAEYRYGDIRVDTRDRQKSLLARAVVHEYGHGVYRSSADPDGTINEETFARLFELGVADLIRSNGPALTVLIRAIRSEP